MEAAPQNTIFKIPRWPFRDDKLFGILSFAILLIPLVFTLFGYENFDTVKFALWSILIGAGAIIFLLSLPRPYNKLPVGLSLALGLFLVWSVLVTLGSVDIEHAIFGFYYRFSNGLLFYLLFVILIFLLLKVLTLEKGKFLAQILIFDAVVVSFIGILQVFGIGYYESLDQGGFVRAPSLLGNPNFSSLFVALVLPWALSLALQARKFSAKVYYWLVVAISIAAIVVFSSRGAILAAVVAAFAFFIYSLHQYWSWKKAILMSMLSLAGLVAVVFSLQIVRPGTIESAISLRDTNTISRLQVWRDTWTAAQQHPWLGEGLGSFNIFFEQNHGQELLGGQGEFDDAHNLFLQLAATGGFPLAGIFLALLIWVMVFCWRTSSHDTGMFRRAGFASVAAFLVGASFNPVSIGCFLALAVAIGLACFTEGWLSQEQWHFGLRCLSSILAAIAIIFGISLIAGEQVFAFGYRQYYEGKYQSSYRLVRLAEYLHPINSFYRIFQIGNEIQLRQNLSSVPKQIEDFKNQHPLESRSYLIAGKLYYLLFFETKNNAYLQPAIDNVKRAIALDPSYIERDGLLAAYEFVDHRNSSALAHANWELAGKPDELAGWLLKAKIYQLAGDKLQAVAALEQAYKFHPDLEGLKYVLMQAKAAADIKAAPIEVYLDENKID